MNEFELDLLVGNLEHDNRVLWERVQVLEKEQWVCPFCYNEGCKTPGQCKELAIRNQVIDEVAHHIEQFKAFGKDTTDSFAIYIRNLKK